LKRNSQLDGIRGVAIASVLIDHFGQILDMGVGTNRFVTALSLLTRDGWMGVDIFFVLSGFLITGIILHERDRPNFWSSFYIRRAVRILPIFIIVFDVGLAASRIFYPSQHIALSYVVAATFFLANWTILNHSEVPMLTHIWSLAVEEQFYFLWPQAAKRLSLRALLRLTLAMAFSSELLRIALTLLNVPSLVIYKITPTRIDGLAIGAALAVAVTIPSGQRFLEKWWRWITLIATGLLGISFLVLRGGSPVLNSQVLGIPPVIWLTSMMIFAASTSALPSWLARFFAHPVMTYLGRRSYALYLINRPIQIAVQESRKSGYLAELPHGLAVNLMLIVGSTAVTFILAEISWWIVETPAQNLRHVLLRKRPLVGPVVVEL
jgi:peptidoglycan/LPS O-acetylase OafA/YrhL